MSQEDVQQAIIETIRLNYHEKLGCPVARIRYQLETYCKVAPFNTQIMLEKMVEDGLIEWREEEKKWVKLAPILLRCT